MLINVHETHIGSGLSKYSETCININSVIQVHIEVKWSFRVALNTVSTQN